MGLIVLASLFVTCLVVANIVAVKIMVLGPFMVPAGAIAYPLTFLFTDTIAELYGRKVASRVVWIGFGASLLMVGLVYLSRILPAAPFWENQEAFGLILGAVPRIVLASMIAYLISQHHDVFAFHFWRKKTAGRFLWFRNNASTVVSQAIDTSIFITIAFIGLMPGAVLINMMVSQYILKLLIAVADTPFCYLLVGLMKKYTSKEGVKMYEGI